MNINNFNQEELIYIEKLLQISKKISDIYNKISELETNNNEFEYLINSLNIQINCEKDIYSKLTYQECIKIRNLLAKQIKTITYDIKITSTIKNYDKRIIIRILNNLTKIILSNKEFQKNQFSKELINNLKELNENNNEELFYQSFNNNLIIHNNLNNDINNLFLSILQEFILENTNLSNELIKIKYYLIYTNKELEDLLINNKFKINNITYINSKIISDILKEKPSYYNIIKSIELKIKIDEKIKKLLHIKDSYYHNKQYEIYSIILQCHIRALLILMDNNDIENLIQDFYNLIKSKDFQNNKISENIILNCFKQFKTDKQKVRILSLK